MRKLVFIFLIALLLGACSNNTSNLQWEYRIIPLFGTAAPSAYLKQDINMLNTAEDHKSLTFMNPVDWEQSLNLYGKDGWELVSTYSTIETVFPNFGEYHTGIKENTRTNTIYFVFKRKKKE